MAELKIFKLNRIKFDELWDDATNYIKATYGAAGRIFTPASPFGQLLQILLHLGRMVLYYIEDSITGLNIRTAYRPDQIRGLAQLTGHNACRPISSRGAITIQYSPQNGGDSSLRGKVCYIPNKTVLKSKLTGVTYTVLFGADNAKITMNLLNYVPATIVQGRLKVQSATGTGEPLQSFNFSERNYEMADEYFINVYVNGKQWEVVRSLQDLGFNQEGVILRTGMNDGFDIFFGNGIMGKIPGKGSTILVEYIVSDGSSGNISMDYVNSDNFWEFDTPGYLADGTTINLNNEFIVKMTTDLIFGTPAENIQLTQLLAPHTSRSYVLANDINYKYFFKRMGIFSDVDIIHGSYNRTGLTVLNLAQQAAQNNYDVAMTEVLEAKKLYGEDESRYQIQLEQLTYAENSLRYINEKINSNKYQDNTIYIYLVPDITKRIASNENYFTCKESVFKLTETEQSNLLKLIDMSGQRVLSVENKIIQPKYPRFAINVYVDIFDNYFEADVYNSALSALSKFLINLGKRKTLPVSDLIALFEGVNGVDSVKVIFVADVNNKEIYTSESPFENETLVNDFGIDSDYGDIKLTRKIINAQGLEEEIADIMPLFRGGFTGTDGVYYTDDQSMDSSYRSPFNFTIRNKTKNQTLTLDNYAN